MTVTVDFATLLIRAVRGCFGHTQQQRRMTWNVQWKDKTQQTGTHQAKQTRHHFAMQEVAHAKHVTVDSEGQSKAPSWNCDYFPLLQGLGSPPTYITYT